MSDSPMNPSEFRPGFFKDNTTNSVYWLSDAQLMYRGSRVLFERQTAAWTKHSSGECDSKPFDWTSVEIELIMPALLLSWFAMELLLKACALKRGVGINELIKNSHGLSVLANTAGFRPDTKESQLLDILERSILWSGRYPVPKDVKNFDPGQIQDFAGSHVPEFERDTDVLYEKIKSLYHAG